MGKIGCRKKVRCHVTSLEKDPRAITLVFDLAKSFKRVRFQVVWAWATYFNFPKKILRVMVEMELLAPSHCAARCFCKN